MDRKVFYSNRTDGLGERLRALLNAMMMAKLFGGDYRFSWSGTKAGNQFHATEKVNEIFSDAFIQEHYQATFNGEKACSIVDFLKNPKEEGAFECAQVHDRSFLKKNAPDLPLENGSYAELFEEIGFSSAIREAITCARRAPRADGSLAPEGG